MTKNHHYHYINRVDISRRDQRRLQVPLMTNMFALRWDQRRLQVPPALERLLGRVRQAPRGSLGLRRGQGEPQPGDDVVRPPAAPLVPQVLSPDRRVRLGHPLPRAQDVDEGLASQVLRRRGALAGGGIGIGIGTLLLLLLARVVADSAPGGGRGFGPVVARAHPCLCPGVIMCVCMYVWVFGNPRERVEIRLK